MFRFPWIAKAQLCVAEFFRHKKVQVKKKIPLIPWSKITKEHVRGELPWFKFDPWAWLSDEGVCKSEYEEKGIYIQLLTHCWVDVDCSIPADIKEVQKILKLKQTRLKNIKTEVILSRFFVEHPYKKSRLTQRRILFERIDSLRIMNSKSKGGKTGKRGGWKDEKSRKSVKRELKDSSSKSEVYKKEEVRKKSKIKTNKHLIENPEDFQPMNKADTEVAIKFFERFWREYPRKGGKKKSRYAFLAGCRREGVKTFIKIIEWTRDCYVSDYWIKAHEEFENIQWVSGETFFTKRYLDYLDHWKNKTKIVQKPRLKL